MTNHDIQPTKLFDSKIHGRLHISLFTNINLHRNGFYIWKSICYSPSALFYSHHIDIHQQDICSLLGE